MRTLFFQDNRVVYAVLLSGDKILPEISMATLTYLLDANYTGKKQVVGPFIGPRREIVTPASTNATEGAMTCGVLGIERIELFTLVPPEPIYDPMLQAIYKRLDQKTLILDRKPDPVIYVDDIAEYNDKEGLALSVPEVIYLTDLAKKNGRSWTDSELFGFAQANSEHCRHKIFNGDFRINGHLKTPSLFGLIKSTTKTNPGRVVSAYVDNCAFLDAPSGYRFSIDDKRHFVMGKYDQLISLKAETHNFPTTVKAFPGAATGTGGEIRDRMGGGRGSNPMAGTAVYMTPYPRFNEVLRGNLDVRKWLYQTPQEILIQASNGASDYGNKFGQPLINGSVLTFEHFFGKVAYSYDKVILQAGGIGSADKEHLEKTEPQKGDVIILLGGDNYRIGMGGGAVSSTDTGHYIGAIELNAVQRANPEMQKRVFNVIRACYEMARNPIKTVHDHGAGGHINCLSEIVGKAGGIIYINRLPIGDHTLSFKEIIGNESQERMAILVDKADVELIRKIAETERSPMFEIGEITGDGRFIFRDEVTGAEPFNMLLTDMFGNPPKTTLVDDNLVPELKPLSYVADDAMKYLKDVLSIEAVACKDWLTSKVDRSVTGKVARQQCVGPLQLPLSDLGAVTLDYVGDAGIATAIGHAPVPALIDVKAGMRLSLAEALTNLVFAPIKHGMSGISCSANWMWPCRNPGEDARLYDAVQALSDFAIALGINIPTGKDSLSMTQKYPSGEKVLAPGTVIISAVGEVDDVKKIVTPVIKTGNFSSKIIRIDFSSDRLKLGGSSFAQTISQLGDEVPDVVEAKYFIRAFEAVQQLINNSQVLAGHDISAGGLITTLLEMCFADNDIGLNINFDTMFESDLVKVYFAENPGVVLQVIPEATAVLDELGIFYEVIGSLGKAGRISTKFGANAPYNINISDYRDIWYKTSFNLDRLQSNPKTAIEKLCKYKNLPLFYNFPNGFSGKLSQFGLNPLRNHSKRPVAAIIREKGSNGDREMAWILHVAGFDVKDVPMTKLISGEETLDDVQFIVFVGGFSNSDILGSAKIWAGVFKYNEKADMVLKKFYSRPDTMSLGVCNGCQLMVHLNLIGQKFESSMAKMLHNESGRFESGFVGVHIIKSSSIMLESLDRCELGIWIAHGEGKFSLPGGADKYNIAMKYNYDTYPANPNGSDFATAAIVSDDGRHLAMMPHPERCLKPHNWAYYPESRSEDEVTPWIEMFTNARTWCERNKRSFNY